MAFRHSGDGACFAPLFDRYAERLYALVHHIDHDRSRVEDCVQETFKRALEEIDQFDESREGSSFWAWLADHEESTIIQAKVTTLCHEFLPSDGARNGTPLPQLSAPAIPLWPIAPIQEGKFGRRV